MSDALTDKRSQHEAWEDPKGPIWTKAISTGTAQFSPTSWEAKTVLSEAAAIVSSDRAAQHGDKTINHQNIAALWSAYLGQNITCDQVAIMMVLLKVARTKTGGLNRDDFVDMAGYAGCAAEINGKLNGLF